MKVYAESKIKPTKINITTVKLLKKQYPILDSIGFFSTKTTSTNDIIYVIDFDKVGLIKKPTHAYQTVQKYQVAVNGKIIEGLHVEVVKSDSRVNYSKFYRITSDHWRTQELKVKRTIIALDNKDFNIQIDKAVETTKGVIDKLEYRIKKLKKIDWKV